MNPGLAVSMWTSQVSRSLPLRATCGSLGEPFDAAETAGSERREWSLCPRPAARAERWSRSIAAVSDSLMGSIGTAASNPLQRSDKRWSRRLLLLRYSSAGMVGLDRLGTLAVLCWWGERQGCGSFAAGTASTS